mgnify:CR=1 FL=1
MQQTKPSSHLHWALFPSTHSPASHRTAVLKGKYQALSTCAVSDSVTGPGSFVLLELYFYFPEASSYFEQVEHWW